MRSIVFKGKFGHTTENTNNGTIVFCHFEPEDNEKTIFQAAKKFTDMTDANLILVPFAHLFERCADTNEAKNLFENLVKKCEKLKNEGVIVIPFGVEKEFFLYAPAKNSAIKFMKF